MHKYVTITVPKTKPNILPNFPNLFKNPAKNPANAKIPNNIIFPLPTIARISPKEIPVAIPASEPFFCAISITINVAII